MVASPDWLAAAAEDPTLNQEPVGTGPFVFDSRSQDSITRVVRNDEWWGGEVHLDAVEFWPVPDPATRADLLFGGEMDGLHVTDPAIVGDLRDDDRVQNVIDETGQEQFVQLNTSAPPFDDERARQALALATPLQIYRDLIGLGIARGADQMFIPESRFYNPDVVQQGDDPAAAAALAADYCDDVPDGCSDGRIDVEFQFASTGVIGARQADILAEGWGEAFNVDFDELAQDQHILQTFSGQYQATLWRAFGSLEPATGRHALMCRTIGEGISLNGPRFCSEARDALILDAQAQLDEAARVVDWQGVVQDMNDAFTYVFLLHTIWDNVFNESVRGVCDRTSPDGVPLRCVVNGVSWFDSVWLSD
jgi:ABC-type transport system substrate-binding protein